MQRARGFTLVELMAVLAVLALAGAAVLLTMPGDRDALAATADAFAAKLLHARDEAVLGMRTVEVTATAQGYGFTRRRFDDWQPIGERPFGNVAWDEGTRPRLPPGARQVGFRFDPTGTSGPRTLVLVREGRTARIAVDGAGAVTVDAGAR
jgi:general secretion pathway protein H